jgi:HEAT repeat protein/nitrate/nitrite transporter NarK
MPRTITDAEKTRRLPWIIASDGTTSIFTYLTYFGPPFLFLLDYLGLPKTSIGALMSLLPFFGLTSLLTAPYIARFGFRRVWLIFYGLRHVVTILLLLTPFVQVHWGARGAFLFIGGVLAVFALCRALAETAVYPWTQEMIPDAVRGKFLGKDSMVCAVASAVGLIFGGYVQARASGLQPYMIMIAVGLLFGFASWWCSLHWVGGEPIREGRPAPSLTNLRAPLRDRNFVMYLTVYAVLVLAGGVNVFGALYLKESIGLPEPMIIWLSIFGLAGTLITAYVWGWAADRYGARPVTLVSLTYLMPLPALLWFMLPRHSSWSAPGAAALFFLASVFSMGWSMGATRLLFTNIVPREKVTQYMAVYYAWMGLTGGCTPLLAGWLLDQLKGLHGHLGPFTVDQYTPLWAANVVLVLISAALLSRIRTGETPVRKFTGMFFQGNPLLAAEAILRHGAALEEETRISATEMMGRAKSPLNVEELIESLHDPSYGVRHEAIVAIAHMPPDEKLVKALHGVLDGKHPDLAVTAAWALGRLGPAHALEPLREALNSEYPMVAAAAARALGHLHDRPSQPELLERFRALDPGTPLRTAYAAALGSLRCREAAPDLLAYLGEQEGPAEELALALARIIGGERRFIRLWRGTRADFSAGVAQAIGAWRGKVKRLKPPRPELQEAVEAAYDYFILEDAEAGRQELARLLTRLMYDPFPEPLPLIMRECALLLEQDLGPQEETLLVALHAVGVCFSYLLGERSSPSPAPQAEG